LPTFAESTALLEAGLDLSPVISKRLHYTQFEGGFERLARGVPGKIVIDWA